MLHNALLDIYAFMFTLICYIIKRITGEPSFTTVTVDQNANNDVPRYWSDCVFTDFGPPIRDSEDEIEYRSIATREEAEEALSQMEESKPYNDEQSSPIFIDRSRNNHVVIGHQMRPQTASLATERVRRQKIC